MSHDKNSNSPGQSQAWSSFELSPPHMAVSADALHILEQCKNMGNYNRVYTRDGSVGPVSQYRDHFPETSLRDFTTATSLVNTYNGRKSRNIRNIPKI